MSLRVGDHVRLTFSPPGGPPVGAAGTISVVVPKTHDDMPVFACGIFDWPGRFHPVLPRGSWIFADHEVEVIQHCQKPAACICGSREAKP